MQSIYSNFHWTIPKEHLTMIYNILLLYLYMIKIHAKLYIAHFSSLKTKTDTKFLEVQDWKFLTHGQSTVTTCLNIKQEGNFLCEEKYYWDY